MSKTLIKQLAYNAKIRMANSSTYKQKNNKTYLKNNMTINDKNDNLVNFPTRINSEIKIECVNSFNNNDTEKDLREKIISILKQDVDVINPFEQLIDYDYFNSLTEQDKQLYILKLSNFYTKTRKIFINGSF